MQRIDTVEFERNPIRYVRRAERGDTLEITELGVPVALLTPVPATEDLTLKEQTETATLAPALQELRRAATTAASMDEPSSTEILSEAREDEI